jgi:branched-chain amino acid transport system permease protein
MRFIFKTSYEQDIRLAKHGGHVFWYSLLCLALVAAPWVAPEYWLAQLTFVLIYAIVGLGLMLLAGFTGLFSLGHAAFLGVGAYTQAVLTGMGWPFALSLACAAGVSGLAPDRSPEISVKDRPSPSSMATPPVRFCQRSMATST